MRDLIEKLMQRKKQRRKIFFRANKSNRIKLISLFLIILMLTGCGFPRAINDRSYEPVIINAGDRIPEDLISDVQETMLLLNAKYIEAVIKTNSVIYMDPNSIEFEEWSVYVDNAAFAWDEVITYSEKLKELAAAIGNVKVSAKPFSGGFSLSWFDFASSKAYASNRDRFPINKEVFLPLDNPHDNMLYDVYFSQSNYGNTEVSIVDKKQMARRIYDSAPAYKIAIEMVSDFYGIDAAEARNLIEEGLKQRENWENWKRQGLITGEVVSRLGRLVPSTLLTIGAVGGAAVVGTPLAITAGAALAIGTGVSYGLSLHDELIYITGAIRDKNNEEIENYLILKNNPKIGIAKSVFDLTTAVKSLTNIKDPNNFLVVADLVNQVIDLPKAHSYAYFNGISEEYLLMPGKYVINGKPLTIENYDGWMPIFNEVGYEFQGWNMEVPGMVWPGQSGIYKGTFESYIYEGRTFKVPMQIEVFPDGRLAGRWEGTGSFPDIGIISISTSGSINGVIDNGIISGSGVSTATANYANGYTYSDSSDFVLSGNISGDLMQLKMTAGGKTEEYTLKKQ
ncbi:hypothetical protein SAMN02745221_02186 [Thermosyntropha lipolytica DSM 11003]|uniref:Uncharacterized protein n=1 Tax=Thermosyntropha lipolytica DSM 11003 TaxID=1123382 RepID=A0A1M5SAF5_9FIRM|nr:hypothetical protein [Thermosyntropha lipolytica]SHH34883.1 hypothetical protein SAMN02745221_02186 [Thermosyntropha lipolytica DSM 11003]